jgi:serine/threonine protein kinase
VVGTTINHYEVISKLGHGGMGEVYVAEDTKLNRRVALKILPPELAEKPERRERFEREAQAVAALNHPNIVTIHSVEEVSGVEGHESSLHFITMELVDGSTLDEAMPAEGFSLSDFFEIAIPVAEARELLAGLQGVAPRPPRSPLRGVLAKPI